MAEGLDQMREKRMTMSLPESTKAKETSLTRDILLAARYYLGKRSALLILGGLAMAIGLYFGGWGWLVAAGLAPLVLSLLPCTVMCVFGVCMMCRSNKTQLAAARDSLGDPASPTPLGATTMQKPAAGGDASCCQGPDQPNAPQSDATR
jgi:hypothetical protein